MDAYEAITTRRSVRLFDGRPVPRDVLQRALRAACLSPAPHHTRPWRFVVLENAESRRRLAESMGRAWRRDLEADRLAAEQIASLLAKSRRRIEEAPALVLACLVGDGLRDWPDERRRRAEWGMAQQSLGCALEAIMVAAHAEGVASYWISAPLFAPEAVREALELPPAYDAQALVALGYASAQYEPRPRPEPDLSELVARR